MAPRRLGYNQGYQTPLRDAYLFDAITESPESAAEKALSKSVASGMTPIYSLPEDNGNVDPLTSFSTLRQRNERLLMANETAFNNLDLQGGKGDYGVEQAIAQAFLAFTPIVAGYMMGGDRGAASGAAAGLIGQKTFQDVVAKQEAKEELQTEKKKAVLLKELERRGTRADQLEIEEVKEAQADEDRDINFRNQMSMIRESNRLANESHGARLRQTTAELLNRGAMGLGGSDGEGMASQAQIDAAINDAQAAGNSVMVNQLRATKPGNLRTRDLYNLTAQLTKQATPPAGAVEGLGNAAAFAAELRSLQIPERLKTMRKAGASGAMRRLIPTSEARALASNMGAISLAITAMIQGKAPSDAEREAISSQFDSESIYTGQAEKNLRAKIAGAKAKYLAEAKLYATNPQLRDFAKQALEVVNAMEAEYLGVDPLDAAIDRALGGQ